VITAAQPRWRRETLRAVFEQAKAIDDLDAEMAAPRPGKSVLALARRMRRRSASR
jgi:hypothetical protein